MASINRKTRPVHTTHEGAPARRLTLEQQLRRSVMACLLWEDGFYEDGVTVAQRIAGLVPRIKPEVVARMAREARNEQKLRHVPLLLARELARHPDVIDRSLIADTLEAIIWRPDELTEFLALYWADGRQPLAAQVKKGLARAFCKFDAYQLAKYNRDGAVKLRDVLFLCHAKPKDEGQEQTWKQLVDGTLPSPDTWEVALSTGEDKREAFTRLLEDRKLGYMALLRNLRGMLAAGVDERLIRQRLLEGAGRSKALPFRFIAAAKYAPQLEDTLDKAMLAAMEGMPRLSGKTVLLVDVSYSMSWALSGKSELRRIEAAAALAALARGVCEDVEIFTFSLDTRRCPPRQGMALIDVIKTRVGGGTYLGRAVKEMNKIDYDRLIVFTDEQSADSVPNPAGRGYMINVAGYKNGVGYGKWTHIDGFSEAVIRWIQEYENADFAE